MSGNEVSIDEHWNQLVTAALLGTDRRDPPAPVGPLVDLVADTARTAPSERMLAHVAACTAVRRAAVTPGPVAAPLAAPPSDERPPCPPAAVERWHHIIASWPVLEDEWLLALVAAGWRASPELAPVMLRRHRSDPRRRAMATAVIGPLAPWLVEQLPELVSSASGTRPEFPGELPALPISPELAPLLTATGTEAGGVLALGFARGAFGSPHRGVLVNVVARIRPDALGDLAEALEAVDPSSVGYGLATVLADLATTRRRMLAELAPGDEPVKPAVRA
jgi:hypothetical protein